MGKQRVGGAAGARGRDGGRKFLFDGGRGGGEGKKRGEVFIHRPHQRGIETNVNSTFKQGGQIKVIQTQIFSAAKVYTPL